MGLYEHKGDGALSLLAGRGRAEYGASTMRSGSLTTNAIANGQLESYDVVFDTPMPDTDYLVEIETMRAYALISVDHRTASSPSLKTVNGFRIHVVAAGSNLDSFTIKWKAYKLYTDTEYNELLDANNWKYISCTKTEVGVSAVQAALSQTPPANMKEFYIEFEIAGGKLYTFFAPKGGDANLINALNNAQYHCYAYGTIMSNNTLQCTMTSKGTGYSSYPLYVTGMYYR